MAFRPLVDKRSGKPDQGEGWDRRLVVFGVRADGGEERAFLLCSHLKAQIGELVPQARKTGMLSEHEAMLAAELRG